MNGTTEATGTGNLTVGTTTYGDFSVSITSNTSDPTGTGLGSGDNGTTHSPSTSELQTTTFTIQNGGAVFGTIHLAVTGLNFTVEEPDRLTPRLSLCPEVRAIRRVRTTRSQIPTSIQRTRAECQTRLRLVD